MLTTMMLAAVLGIDLQQPTPRMGKEISAAVQSNIGNEQIQPEERRGTDQQPLVVPAVPDPRRSERRARSRRQRQRCDE